MIDTVTISIRAESVVALMTEVQKIEIEQLELAKQMGEMMNKQYFLARKHGALCEAVSKLMGVQDA